MKVGQHKTKTKIYWVWRNILLRCSSNHPVHYSKYKGRGIYVCERWKSFENFLADMGDSPHGLSIDRKDNDGPYNKENCRWATRTEQMRNRRSIRPLTLHGRTQLLTDWAAELGIGISTISMRLDKYGWSVERALRNYNEQI